MMEVFGQIFIWVALVCTAVFSAPLGGLGLLFGYMLLDREFALINISNLINFPLFLTEPILLILFIHAVVDTVRQGRWADWQINKKSPWLWFYAVGILNALVGLLHASPTMVVRDAVIVFYGFIAQITIVYVRNLRHFKIIFFVMLTGLLIRPPLYLFYDIFNHGSSAFGMYTSFIILTCLCTFSLWGRFKPLAMAIVVFFISLMTINAIRTVWLGFFVGYVFLIGLFLWLRVSRRPLAVGAISIIISIFVTVSGLYFLHPRQYNAVRNEFMSFFAGKNSPNLLTRLAMWEDALQEVLPVTKGWWEKLDADVLKVKYFRARKPEEETIVLTTKKLETSATSLLMKYEKMNQVIPTVEKPNNQTVPSPIPSPLGSSALLKVENSPSSSFPSIKEGKKHTREKAFEFMERFSFMRTLFGVPFGKRFIPTRISKWHQVDRYDPHNSFIAMLYRTGLVGFTLFLMIVFGTVFKGLRALKATTHPEHKYILMSLLASVVYHCAHSMTDVTLENPFRGGPLWFLLGLTFALLSIIKNESRDS